MRLQGLKACKIRLSQHQKARRRATSGAQTDGIQTSLALIVPGTALNSGGGAVLDVQVACRATRSVFEADETRHLVDGQRMADGKCSRCRRYWGAWKVGFTPYKTSYQASIRARHMLCSPQYSWQMDVRGWSEDPPREIRVAGGCCMGGCCGGLDRLLTRDRCTGKEIQGGIDCRGAQTSRLRYAFPGRKGSTCNVYTCVVAYERGMKRLTGVLM